MEHLLQNILGITFLYSMDNIRDKSIYQGILAVLTSCVTSKSDCTMSELASHGI